MFSIAARIFNIEQFGLLSFFITITMLIYTGLDFGHRMMVVRDISAAPEKIKSTYLLDKVWLKIAVFAVVALFLLGYAGWKDFWGYHKIIVVLLLITGLAKGLCNLYFAVFQGLVLFRNETKSLGFFVMCIGLTLVASYLKPSIAVFTTGYAISALLQLAYTHYLAVQDIEHFSLQTVIGRFCWSSFKNEARLGAVFAGIVLVEIGFSSSDSFFVEHYYSAEDLGFFEGFKKLFLGLNVFAMILAVAVFPEVSKRLQSDARVGIVFVGKTFVLLAITGLSIVLVYSLFNELIIDIIFGSQFAILRKWDSYLIMIVLASYFRVAPNLYFVGSKKESYRFCLSGLFMVVEIFLFLTILQGSAEVEEAIKLITYIHIGLTVAGLLVALIASSRQYRLHNNVVC
jgi:O-antigen/teichoic acid export membrane protein